MCAGFQNASNGAFNSPNCEDFSHCAHCSAFNVAHSVGAQWRVVAARSATGMGTLNPKPRDLDKAAVIMNGDEMRLRRADEQTEAGMRGAPPVYRLLQYWSAHNDQISTPYTRAVV
jgi:hypothetical protein